MYSGGVRKFPCSMSHRRYPLVTGFQGCQCSLKRDPGCALKRDPSEGGLEGLSNDIRNWSELDPLRHEELAPLLSRSAPSGGLVHEVHRRDPRALRSAFSRAAERRAWGGPCGPPWASPPHLLMSIVTQNGPASASTRDPFRGAFGMTVRRADVARVNLGRSRGAEQLPGAQ